MSLYRRAAVQRVKAEPVWNSRVKATTLTLNAE